MRIVYCDKCDTRIAEEDIESGKAFTDANGDVYCVSCASVSLKSARKTSSYKIMPAASRQPPPERGGRRTTPTRSPNISVHSAHPSHPSTHAPHHHAVPPGASASVKWGVAGAISLVTLIVGYFVFRGKTPEPQSPRQAAQAEKAADRVPAPSPQPTTRAQKERTRGIFDEMVKEHERGFDPEVVKATAARRLQEAIDFSQKHPDDLWKYLDMLRQVQPDTPAGAEAAKTIIALKVPLDKSESPGWYRDWTFTEKNGNARNVLLYDFAGRKNVVQTTPITRNSEVVFQAQIHIPVDKPHLIIAGQGENKGASRVAVEIDGKQQLLEDLHGKIWQEFDLNLDYFKGRKVAVQIRQIAAGLTVGNAYWAPPALRAQSMPDAAAIAFNPSAPPYMPPKAAGPPPHVILAPLTWKETITWKSAVDLLSIADPKTGAVVGSWSRDGKSALRCNKVKGARLAFDYKLPATYDVKAVFERKDGSSDVTLILTHGKRQFVWQMGAEQNKYFAIAQVGDKKFDGNPAAVANGNCLKNNERYTTVIEVRKDRVSAYLNGAYITEWTPDMGELNISGTWKLPDGKPIGIGAFDSEAIFHSLEVVEVK